MFCTQVNFWQPLLLNTRSAFALFLPVGETAASGEYICERLLSCDEDDSRSAAPAPLHSHPLDCYVIVQVPQAPIGDPAKEEEASSVDGQVWTPRPNPAFSILAA